MSEVNMSSKEELIAWEVLELALIEPLVSSRGNGNLVKEALRRADYFEEHGMLEKQLADHRHMDGQ